MTTPTPTVASHASESGHWYSRSNMRTFQQIETVPSKSGVHRPATLRDARKLDYAPGVTTIIGCSAKPALTNWMVNQGILAALTLPRREGESETAWLARVHEDRTAQSRAAAEEGTRIHAAVQAFVQGEPFNPAYDKHVAGVRQALGSLPTCGWTAEACVGHFTGYGTKADLHVWDGDTLYVIDFKGKDGDQAALDAMNTYDDHAMQLAATAEAILYAQERGGYGHEGGVRVNAGILFVSRTDPGAASLRWVDTDTLLQGWEMFSALLSYWRAKTGHRPWGSDLPEIEF